MSFKDVSKNHAFDLKSLKNDRFCSNKYTHPNKYFHHKKNFLGHIEILAYGNEKINCFKVVKSLFRFIQVNCQTFNSNVKQ